MEINNIYFNNPALLDGITHSLLLFSPEEILKLSRINKIFCRLVQNPLIWEQIRLKNHIEPQPHARIEKFVPGVILQRKLNEVLFTEISCDRLSFAHELNKSPNLLSLIDRNGNTLLHYIFQKDVESTWELTKKLEIINCLTKNELEKPNFHGDTPLNVIPFVENICQYKFCSAILLKAIECEADFNLKNKQGDSFFHRLASHSSLEAPFFQRLIHNFFNNLKENKVQFKNLANSQNAAGFSPLEIAIQSKNAFMIEMLTQD